MNPITSNVPLVTLYIRRLPTVPINLHDGTLLMRERHLALLVEASVLEVLYESATMSQR